MRKVKQMASVKITTHEDALGPPAEYDPLTAADRCDRCGAQAYFRYTLFGGSDLLFCAHHGLKFRAKLENLSAHIQDETGRL
jgi:hypothetical protein